MSTVNANTGVHPTNDEMVLLIKNHLQHDLTDSDRDALQSAVKKFRTRCAVSSILGAGLGVIIAFRLRRSKMLRFTTFQSQERPMHVRFADGRTGESEP